jgi:hypothetical protein
MTAELGHNALLMMIVLLVMQLYHMPYMQSEVQPQQNDLFKNVNNIIFTYPFRPVTVDCIQSMTVNCNT